MSSDHTNETYRSLLSIAVEGLRSLLLLNGGAMVAVLAYLGQLGDAARAARAPKMVWPASYFIAGLVLAMSGFVFAYLTQHALFNEAHERETRFTHQQYQWTGFGAALLSLAAFGLGAFASIYALASN